MTTTDTATGSGRTRTIFSLLTTVLPLPFLLWSQTTLSSRLPDEMPIHWEPGGGADATIAAENFYSGSLTAVLVGVVIAIVGHALVRLPLVSRRVLIAIGASIAAVSASMWISAAIAVTDRNEALGVPMGPGALLTMVSIVYGLLPALLFTSSQNDRTAG